MLSRWAIWLFGIKSLSSSQMCYTLRWIIENRHLLVIYVFDNTYTRIKGNFSLVFIIAAAFFYDIFTCTSWISLINLNQNFDLNVFSNFATKRQWLLRDLSEQSYRILKLFPIEFHFLTFSPNKTYFKDLRWLIVQI